MTAKDNINKLGDITTDSPLLVSEDAAPKASESKIAPPVAPKPAWFHPGLKNIRDNPAQGTQACASEDTPAASFTRNLGGRTATGAVNISFKQKIRSFETFSGSEAQERRASRRSTPLSDPNALIKKESTSLFNSYSTPDRHDSQSNQELPKRIQSDQQKSVMNEKISAPESANTSDNTDSCGSKSKSYEDDLSCSEIIPLSDTVGSENESAIDANLASGGNDGALQQSKQESELEETDIGSFKESRVLPSASSGRIHQKEAVNHLGENSGHNSGELLTTADSAPPTSEGQPQKCQEGEDFRKVLAFSNQVSQAFMRCLPTLGNGNPQSQSSVDPPLKDADNAPDSELCRDSTNKGFSVSLATLRECTIEHEGQTFDQAAHLHSVMSVIPSQEIQKMIEEVQALDEKTLRLLDIHVVILHKDVGAGLGFSIAAGCDLENKAPTVHKVFPSGLAAQEGTIQKGDEVLSVNGATLRGVKHVDATAALRQTRNQNLAVVVICKRTNEESKDGEEANANIVEQKAPLRVDLEKGAGGIGFSLEGGRGTIQGDRPLVINRIFKGGAGEQSGLQCGDELLQVQGVSLQNMTRFEAWNMIKALPDGPVSLMIRKRQEAEE